jgi:hypothetical protein
MGVQGPEGPKGPSGPIGPAGKDATVDYSKITSDSSLKDSVKGLILNDASFNAMVTKFINDNASKFQGPAGKTTFTLLTSSEKAELIASLVSGSNLNSLISGIVDNDTLKNAITQFIRDNSNLFIPKSGIFSSSDPKFEEWLSVHNKSTLYCANGDCVIPTGDSMKADSDVVSQWKLNTDDSAVRFRHSNADKILIKNDGGLDIKGDMEVVGGININKHLRARGGIWGRDGDNQVQVNGPLRLGKWKIYENSNGNLHFENDDKVVLFSMQKDDGRLFSNQKSIVYKGDGIRLRNTRDPSNRYLKRYGDWGTGLTDKQAGEDTDWTVWVPE